MQPTFPKHVLIRNSTSTEAFGQKGRQFGLGVALFVLANGFPGQTEVHTNNQLPGYTLDVFYKSMRVEGGESGSKVSCRYGA